MTRTCLKLCTFAVVLLLGTVAIEGTLCATTYGTVTYTAAGTFTATPNSGYDSFRLAGEPFSISIVANDSQLSKFHGPTYADYGPLHMSGTIYSKLMPTPIAIQNYSTFLLMTMGSPTYDLFEIGSEVKILSISLSITAIIQLPKGTLTTVRNHPFGPVTLSSPMATMTYTDGTSSTTLGIIGTLVATASGSSNVSALVERSALRVPPEFGYFARQAVLPSRRGLLSV